MRNSSISYNYFQHFKALKLLNLNVMFNGMTKMYFKVNKHLWKKTNKHIKSQLQPVDGSRGALIGSLVINLYFFSIFRNDKIPYKISNHQI